MFTFYRLALSAMLIGLVALAQPAPLSGQNPVEAAPSPPESQDLTVFLVRHAEKERGPEVGKDPQLTEAGRARAAALATTLSEVDVDAIYVTQWRRTRETAAPLAERLGLEPVVVSTDPPDFIGRMAELLKSRPGRTVVVVGHSDTTPELARALGAEAAPDIADNDFDDLYQVHAGSGSRLFLHLRFGHPTP